jgi:hypothetical protein
MPLRWEIKHIETRSNGDTWAALRAGLRTTPRVGPPGRATRRAARRAARRTNHSATAPLDRTTLIHTNGHRGLAPLAESTAGLMYRTLELRSGSASHCWSLLYTAGPDNSGRVIRLHLLGPTAILGSGPCRGREDQRGPTRDGSSWNG